MSWLIGEYIARTLVAVLCSLPRDAPLDNEPATPSLLDVVSRSYDEAGGVPYDPSGPELAAGPILADPLSGAADCQEALIRALTRSGTDETSA